VLAGNNNDHCHQFKSYLHQCFKLKNLGTLKHFLEIEVTRSPEGLFLCQRKYALDILIKTGMLRCNAPKILMIWFIKNCSRRLNDRRRYCTLDKDKAHRNHL